MKSHIESTLTKYVQNTSGEYKNTTGGGSATIVYDFVLSGYDSDDWDIPGITLATNDSTKNGRCTTEGDPWTNRWRSKITASASTGFSFSKFEGSYSNGSSWVSVSKTANPYIQDDIITTDSGIWGTSYINLGVYFSRNKYNVRFNANGGDVTEKLRAVYYSATIGTLPRPVRNGYEFGGWYTAASGGSKISTSTIIRADVTYYAHWTANTYKITLNANGGSGGTPAVWFKYGTNVYYSDSSCSTTITAITKPTRTGYTYVAGRGFYIENAVDGAVALERYIAYDSVAFSSDLCKDIYSNVTLKCDWEINTYTLHINYYSSTTNSTKLTTTAESCYVADDTLSPPSSSSSYTFTYVTHTYSTTSQAIVFKLNSSGSYSYYLRIGSAPTLLSYDKIFRISTESYTYNWTPNSNLTINLYVYQRFIISYNVNSGSGTTPATQYKIYGTSVTLRTNSLTRTSYSANGWNTDSPGTGTAYASGATYTANSSRVLYADWTPLYGTVTVKIMTSENGTSWTNSSTGGHATIHYYDDNYNSIKEVSYPLTSGSVTVKPLASRTVTISGASNQGYLFVGVSSGSSPPYNANSGSLSPASNGSYTRNVYFVKDTNNKLKYDSTDKYFYFEDGYFPQSYVGATLNSTLSNASNMTSDRSLKYMNGKGETISIPIYTYNGNKYAMIKATKTQTIVFKRLKFSSYSDIDDAASVTFSQNGSFDLTFSQGSYSDNAYSNSKVQKWTASGYAGEIGNNVFTKTEDFTGIRIGMNGSKEDACVYFNVANKMENGKQYRVSFVDKNSYQCTSGKLTNIVFEEVGEFKENMYYFFKVEPIRWRVSEYGVSSSTIPNNFADYGRLYKNFKVVSDRVLWVGAVTRTDTKESWEFNSSTMRAYFKEIYQKNGAAVSDEMPIYASSNVEKSYYYGPVGQQEKVKYITSTYTGINIATEEEIKTNLTDLRAKASDMVAFILGLDEDSYCDYWTRELGGSLKNGKMITKSGITRSAWLKNFYGVRFSLRMSEGNRA